MKKLSTYFPQLMVTRILLVSTILFLSGIINAQNPTITLLGTNPLKHQVNTPFIDPGATAVDANGTDISSSITMSGLLNVTNFGTYTLSYKATDNNNNTATITRTVIVTDLIPCFLKSTPGTELMNVALNDFTFVEPMVTGTDNYFSTVQITRNNGGFDIAKLGAYNITYTGIDPAGNTCAYNRIIIVKTLTKPIVLRASQQTIFKDSIFNPFKGISVQDPIYAPEDFVNGINGCKLEIVFNNVNPLIPGMYLICYQATNGAGLISEPVCVAVTVVENTAMGIAEAINGNPITVYPNPAETFIEVEIVAPKGAITITDITGKILINDIVESNKKQINVSSLATGVYFVNLMLNGTQTPVAVSKFVKK